MFLMLLEDCKELIEIHRLWNPPSYKQSTDRRSWKTAC